MLVLHHKDVAHRINVNQRHDQRHENEQMRRWYRQWYDLELQR